MGLSTLPRTVVDVVLLLDNETYFLLASLCKSASFLSQSSICVKEGRNVGGGWSKVKQHWFATETT